VRGSVITPVGAAVTALIGLVCVESPRDKVNFTRETSTLIVFSPVYNTGCKEGSTLFCLILFSLCVFCLASHHRFIYTQLF
jgi:hypothetical protein